MTTTPRLGAPELVAGQVAPETTVNEQLRYAEQGAGKFTFKDRDLAIPPVSPADGDAYLVATGGSGAWSGKDGKIAFYMNTAWEFITVKEGFTAYVNDEDVLIGYNGAAWFTLSAGAVTVDNDTTLAGDSATNPPSQHAVKSYVDAAVFGLSWKRAVRVATTANGTLASAFENGDTVDGVVLATGDRILIKDQSTGSQNGIYVVAASGAPARATDADSGAELVNATVYVSDGTANADTQWTCSTNATITVGSTALSFAQLSSGAGTLQAANNLSDLASAAAARTNLGLLRLVGFFFTTTPTVSEVILLYVAADAFTLAANLAGSQVSVGTNPTATFALDLQKNGSTIGTISISTGGAVTLTTVGGTSKAIAAGDVLKVVAPATPDATAANIAATLKGTL